MKTIKFLKYVVFVGFLTTSCDIQPTKSILSFNGNSKIIFTEILTGSSTSDRAIEISNVGDETISLKDYSICIYKNNQTKPYKTFDLSKYNLIPNESFVIAYDKSNENILKRADLVTEDLMIDGTWPLSLNYQDTIVDVLGTIGYQNNYAKQADLVRKKEFLVGRKEINAYDWIKYCTDNYKNLGSFTTTISEAELLEGPKLTAEVASLPFIKDNGFGGGGIAKATLAYTGDGDTTNFYFSTGSGSHKESVRYLKINTPEIQHGTSIDAQPWGYAAKEYNNEVLNRAKSFYIQTERDNSVRDSYERFLGYVWYSNKENAELEDYVCLNNEMLIQGLAFCYFIEENTYNNPITYKDITYTNIFLNNELYAKNKGIKVHGEKDPSFNY